MTEKKLQWMKIRAKKVGVLMYDARVAARRTIDECATFMGISTRQYKSYEKGIRAPSLPEIESFAYFVDIPAEHFWSNEAKSDDITVAQPEYEETRRDLRDRIIATKLRQRRMDADISLRQMAKLTSISAARVKRYEIGENSIPIPELEVLCDVLNHKVEDLFDQKGMIGNWKKEQEYFEKFQELPEDVQDFVTKPGNLPYLDLAIRLSDLSVEKLRQVAEGLLEITY